MIKRVVVSKKDFISRPAISKHLHFEIKCMILMTFISICVQQNQFFVVRLPNIRVNIVKLVTFVFDQILIYYSCHDESES